MHRVQGPGDYLGRTSHIVKVTKMGKKPAKETTSPRKDEAIVHVVLDNPKVLQAILKVAAGLVDSTRMAFNKDGFHMRAVDQSRVGMLQIFLPPSFFSVYGIGTETDWMIDIRAFQKIIARAGKGAAVDMRITPDEPEYLQIALVAGKRRRAFKARQTSAGLFNEDKSDVVKNVTDGLITHKAITFQIDNSAFDEILADAAIVGDILGMEYNPAIKAFSFTTVDDTGAYKQETEIPREDTAIIDFEEHQKDYSLISGHYSIAYMQMMLEIKAVSNNIKVSMVPAMGSHTSGMPVLFNASITGLDTGRFMFALAPRVDVEENEIPDDFGDLEVTEDDLNDPDLDVLDLDE